MTSIFVFDVSSESAHNIEPNHCNSDYEDIEGIEK